jgi:hypothetical protein
MVMRNRAGHPGLPCNLLPLNSIGRLWRVYPPFLQQPRPANQRPYALPQPSHHLGHGARAGRAGPARPQLSARTSPYLVTRLDHEASSDSCKTEN